MMRAVVAVDGSHTSLRALRTFLEMAKEFAEAPEVHAVAVVEYADLPAGLAKAPEGAPDLLGSEAETALAVAAELAGKLGVRLQTAILRGRTIDEVLEYARRMKAQLLVLGTHGRKGINRAILGSTCEGVLRQADVPVLAVRDS
ncbi:MAG: universal stress protein [Candidatus Baltobacteraceae bacterium]